MDRRDGSVVTAGSINVDFIVGVPRLPRAGETVDGDRFSRQGGGKSANQSVAASRFGAAVTLLGAVGDDDMGRSALANLAAEGVSVEACRTLDDEHTGLALIVVDQAGENQIATAPGANDHVDGAMMRAMLRGLEPPADAVCLLSFELGDDALLVAAGWADERGYRLILNPAPARPLSDDLLPFRPILTPNVTEASVLSGVDDPVGAARSLADRTSAPVVVSMGGAGALLWADGRASQLAATPVEPVDTTGAGDALNGILAAELAAGAGLEGALRTAMVGAALSTTALGARAGLPTREAVAGRQQDEST